MTEQNCPRCGQPATGNFCSHCGASLGERFCTQCGSKSEPGARFCNQCGAPVVAAGAAASVPGSRAASRGSSGAAAAGASGGDAGGGGGGNTLAWWISGAFMVALILFVAYPMVAPDDQPAAPAGAAAPFADGGGDAPVDLSSMSPREAADRLYRRVMTDLEAGDSAAAEQFLPMAVSAYDMARPLDLDGLFHLALLQRESGDYEAALATAREGLEDAPDHLLLLSVAAQAAREGGDAATAREYYTHLLAVWDEERARDLPEYEAHARLMSEIRSEAVAFTEGQGGD